MRIEIRNLSKRFGTTIAAHQISFRIDTPQMIGVIGRSGAGKSTLLRMINRLTPADGGAVLVDGVDALALKGAALRAWRRDCAMIFQQFNLAPRLDVVTNVMLGRLNGKGLFQSLFGLFSDAEVAEALDHLARLDVADQALKRAEALSGGQQQRVAIARALMQRPKLILADEPIASLDPLSAEAVMRALRAIRSEDGRSVICNLHSLEAARGHCDRIIGLRAGEVVFDGPVETLTDAAVDEIYGGEAQSGGEAGPSALPDPGPTPRSDIEPQAAHKQAAQHQPERALMRNIG
ncbi:MAG: phosphonate ABC transporter ATP-binding protein [Pseudomonadota bacterium]